MPVQGNALGGEGLARLCPGLAACISLEDLNLRAIGVAEEHEAAVRQFANTASCHPALHIINFDGNLIGTAVAPAAGLACCRCIDLAASAWASLVYCAVQTLYLACCNCSCIKLALGTQLQPALLTICDNSQLLGLTVQ